MNIYIAGPFSYARFIETSIVPKLTSRGIGIASTWHNPPFVETESLERMPPRAVREIAEKNDHDLANAGGMVLLADQKCRETWCELRYATLLDLPVVIVGEPTPYKLPLSAYRLTVQRVATVEDAVDVFVSMQRGERARVFG